MGLISRGTKSATGTGNFGSGTTAKSGEVNTDFNTVYTCVNGNIDNTNISSSAAIAYSQLNLSASIQNSDILTSAGIVDSKLAQITTTGKVSGAALTGLSSIPSGAGVIPIANIATGTPTGSKFVRDDGTLASPTVTQYYVKVSNTQTQNTGGGTATSGAWRTSTINTENSDVGNVCSISSNVITLTSGTYIIRGSHPFFNTNASQARFYNTSDSTLVCNGTSIYNGNGSQNNIVCSFLYGTFTIAAQKNFELQYICSQTSSISGQGLVANLDTEVYAQLEFIKTA